MSQPPKPARKAVGAKPASKAAATPGAQDAQDASLVAVQVKLLPAQRDKLLRLGGNAWLREHIDKARDPRP